MKILCETQVINRQLPNAKSRTAKATLAIGYHPPGKENAELLIIHFTPQNKIGVRYKVKDNLEKVFTKFLNDGKATISFKTPEHNIQIKCDPLQLKFFLQFMKLSIEGKNMGRMCLSAISASTIPQRLQPVTNCVVTKRRDYPLKGFSRTIKSLTITGIRRAKFDGEILTLMNLTTLNLSENCISEIPKELGSLSLVDIDLSSNLLGDCKSSSAWDWLERKPLCNTLTKLILSNNKLSYFPYKIIKLNSIVNLQVNNNNIKKIPFGIRRLKTLRFLHLSSNKLESLPQTISHLRLGTLDVWGNKFQPKMENNAQMFFRNREVNPLWEIAARLVYDKRLPHSPATLPWILVDIISETPLCFCGRLCVSSEIMERVALLNLQNVHALIFNRDQAIYADSVVCSSKCAAKYCLN